MSLKVDNTFGSRKSQVVSYLRSRAAEYLGEVTRRFGVQQFKKRADCDQPCACGREGKPHERDPSGGRSGEMEPRGDAGSDPAAHALHERGDAGDSQRSVALRVHGLFSPNRRIVGAIGNHLF